MDYGRVKPKENIKYNFLIAILIDHLNLIAAKLDYHAGVKWLIHGTKDRKKNQLQCLKHPCKLPSDDNSYETKWKATCLEVHNS